jgi:MinD-like ATPase involved in chromosome partitioning or flagellar assembly/tetratricopeptide (TPR) repeat protein
MPDGDAGQVRDGGQIVTFYSFKGGTGRTMALANAAWILAANGKRVLIADWDLESPGLHRFFQPFMSPAVIDQPGIVDFIRQYEWKAKDLAARIEAPDTSEGAEVRTLQAAIAALTTNLVGQVGQYVVPVKWPFPEKGAIDFLTPGKQANGAYANALSALDWDTLYDDLGGAGFFDALRAELKNSYDYVLIDSRTGLSDIADICTLHLPDMVVDCFTLSTQGIEGAARIARQIQLHSERDITILPVPMRIDHSQRANVLAGLRAAQSLFRGLPAGMSQPEREQYWAEVQVPYLPEYSCEEMLATIGDRPGDRGSLLPAYERIVAGITGNEVSALPPLDEWKRLRTRLLFARTVPPDRPEVVIQYSPQDQMWAEWIVAVLAGAGIYARLADEESARPADARAAERVIAVASEFYFAELELRHLEMRDLAPGARPELLVSVTDMRIPSAGLSDEVPVLFLADRPEAAAVELLIDRFGGRLPSEYQQTAAAMRYPGGRPDQIVNVPVRNANFTGRDAVLLEIREQLRSRSVAVLPPLTIQGTGGVGKTQVALEYTHRFTADYDVVWWLNCGQAQYIDASLADLAAWLRRTFDVPLPGEGAVAEVAKQLLDYLSGQSKLSWLLVYDNVEEEEFDLTIKRLLPSGGGHVLITSRENLLAGDGLTKQLPVFERGESVNHLRRRTPDVPEDEAYRLAESLKDVPLAVATAGALLASENMTVTQYLRLLDTQPLREGVPLGDYPATVTKAWHLSLDRLELRSPAAYRLLSICSVMAPVISLDLVVSDAMVDAVQELDPSVTERSMINRLIRQIDQLALIKVDYSARQMQVHQVVQEVVRQRMSEAQLAAARRDVHQILISVRPLGDVDDPGMWPVYRMIWPHLTPSQAHRSVKPQVRDLLVDRVRYLRQRDDLERGRRRAEEIQRAWIAMLPEQQGPVASNVLRQQLYRLQFNLANILRDLGRYEDARVLDEEVLGGQEAQLGADHQHTLQTRSNLAADLRALGEYRQALSYDMKTYQAWEENSGFGDEYFGILNAANNLALSYVLTGNYQLALRHDQQTLERRLRTYPRSHPRTLNSGSAVGRDLLEGGRYQDALRMNQDVLTQSRDAYGGDSRITLNAYLWLGIAQRCVGEPGAAAANLDMAVDGLSRAFGRESGDTLAARLSRALNYLALGRVQDGRAAAEQVLAAYEERLGPQHPHSLICHLNIGTALCLEGEYAQARESVQQAVDGLESRLGENHPYTLAAKLVLASALARLGELTAAAGLEEMVETARTRVLGPQHPDTVRCRVNLLLTQAELGTPGAAADREKAVAELSALLGDDHPDVRAAAGQERLLSVIDPQPF